MDIAIKKEELMQLNMVTSQHDDAMRQMPDNINAVQRLERTNSWGLGAMSN